MNALNNFGCGSIAFPDVCLVPLPVPQVNFGLSFLNIPALFNVFFGCGIAENLITIEAASVGDAGVGVVSGMCMGPKRPLLGSFVVLVGCMPASRVTSLTGQNGLLPNAPGITLIPTQFQLYFFG